MGRAQVLGLCAVFTLSACGGARGPSPEVRHAAAAAAVTLIAGAAAALVRGHGRQRTETGYENDEARAEAEARDAARLPPLGDAGDTEPAAARARHAVLPLWDVSYAVDLEAEDLWCDDAADCVRVDGVDGCAADAGGVSLAVRRASSERVQAELSDAEPTRPCPGGVDISREGEPGCVDNLCRLWRPDRLGPVPPPPGAPSTAGLPPVPPPP